MKKHFAILLTALFLFVGLGLSFHHHVDGAVHDDCPACVGASHQQAIKTGSTAYAPVFTAVFAVPAQSFISFPVISQTRKTVRAPPFSA